MSGPRLLTFREAAGQLGCSVATVKRRVSMGSLPVFRDGRLVRVREDDLRRFVAERVARATGARPSVAAGSKLAPGTRLWDK